MGWPRPDNLPSIYFWRDRIDSLFVACHAVRGWAVPSNGVWMLVPSEHSRGDGWYEIQACRQRKLVALPEMPQDQPDHQLLVGPAQP